jgi:hypothetical protein
MARKVSFTPGLQPGETSPVHYLTVSTVSLHCAVIRIVKPVPFHYSDCVTGLKPGVNESSRLNHTDELGLLAHDE